MASSDSPPAPWLEVGGVKFRSRLVVGVERYVEARDIADVLHASGADVFITTSDAEFRRSSLLLSDVAEYVSEDEFSWIGTTSFALSSDEAVATARGLRSLLGIEVIKLDVRNPDNSPDAAATLDALATLIGEGFHVLPMLPPAVDTVREAIARGASAVRLLASPVGSFRGIADPVAMKLAVEAATVPTVVEGGLASVADIVQARLLGADAVLANAMIVESQEPRAMAEACKLAMDAVNIEIAARAKVRS